MAWLLLTSAAALLAPPLPTRRQLLGGVSSLALGLPAVARAAPPARLASSPAVELLEPLVELRLSLDALQPAAARAEAWPALRRRLEAFCGGPLSEQYFYLGVAQQYAAAVEYDDLEEFAKTDRRARAEAMEEVMRALRRMKEELRKPAPDGGELAADARAAQQAMGRWLSFVPQADVERATRLYANVAAADADRDGKLSEAELRTLGEGDRAAWKARVAMFGE
ncbi:hypothetical protein AB1Y20_013413 [Prymnesium parvum]|uniref:EF-hand domain-containing protein n=1 Tax=Prymnesium parvum TaxID=97485 RepID=A0AB34IFJ7_PRYPA